MSTSAPTNMASDALPSASIPQLLWAPGRLPSVAVRTGVTASAFVGLAALLLHLTLLMLYITALGDAARFADTAGETVRYYLGEVARSVVPAAALGVLFVYFVSVIGRTSYNYRSQLSLKILLLSPVTMIGPVVIYTPFLLGAAADVTPASWGDAPLRALGQWTVAILGSCAWAPALFVLWLWFWQRAARQVEQLTPAGWPVLCQKCGHDLRGTITAEGIQCPTCGAPLPAQAVSAALSDTQ